MPASQNYTDFNFERYAGETIQLDMTITLSGSPLPISSLTEIWFTCRSSESQADPPILEATKTDGSITAISDPGGTARITLSAADTVGLTQFVTLLCDLKTQETAGSRETVELRGKLTIRPTPTRAIV